MIVSPVQSAAEYSFQVPTANTIWTAGQAGVITITSTDKETSTTKPTDRLLTITLQKDKTLLGSNQVALIRNRLQLLVPAGSSQTSVSVTITDWIVPADLPAGSTYFVQLQRAKVSVWDILPLKETSPRFQIVAPTVPPSPSASGLPTSTTSLTNSTDLPTMTTTTAIMPTASSLPPGTTCNDIQEQCAAQSLTFVDTDQGILCHCGAPLVVPTIRPSRGSPSFQKTDSSMMVCIFSVVIMTRLIAWC
ncbi:hypothetical protein EMPS_08087 [Entomortierella parvispora]|uniref:Uncharacterized protein n=1 Tax=Entomortierella parvispora TaxID=205924 RepID=A0A9P3LZ00_9FUNG|nr:hypothetical protein EMPS_08087 [Entomortierella parvispora]